MLNAAQFVSRISTDGEATYAYRAVAQVEKMLQFSTTRLVKCAF
jgi:hypothetical protein